MGKIGESLHPTSRINEFQSAPFIISMCHVYPMILLGHDVQTDQGNEDDL